MSEGARRESLEDETVANDFAPAQCAWARMPFGKPSLRQSRDQIQIVEHQIVARLLQEYRPRHHRDLTIPGFASEPTWADKSTPGFTSEPYRRGF